jgi:hypothetical protein
MNKKIKEGEKNKKRITKKRSINYVKKEKTKKVRAYGRTG